MGISAAIRCDKKSCDISCFMVDQTLPADNADSRSEESSAPCLSRRYGDGVKIALRGNRLPSRQRKGSIETSSQIKVSDARVLGPCNGNREHCTRLARKKFWSRAANDTNNTGQRKATMSLSLPSIEKVDIPACATDKCSPVSQESNSNESASSSCLSFVLILSKMKRFWYRRNSGNSSKMPSASSLDDVTRKKEGPKQASKNLLLTRIGLSGKTKTTTPSPPSPPLSTKTFDKQCLLRQDSGDDKTRSMSPISQDKSIQGLETNKTERQPHLIKEESSFGDTANANTTTSEGADLRRSLGDKRTPSHLKKTNSSISDRDNNQTRPGVSSAGITPIQEKAEAKITTSSLTKSLIEFKRLFSASDSIVFGDRPEYVRFESHRSLCSTGTTEVKEYLRAASLPYEASPRCNSAVDSAQVNSLTNWKTQEIRQRSWSFDDSSLASDSLYTSGCESVALHTCGSESFSMLKTDGESTVVIKTNYEFSMEMTTSIHSKSKCIDESSSKIKHHHHPQPQDESPPTDTRCMLPSLLNSRPMPYSLLENRPAMTQLKSSVTLEPSKSRQSFPLLRKAFSCHRIATDSQAALQSSSMKSSHVNSKPDPTPFPSRTYLASAVDYQKPLPFSTDCQPPISVLTSSNSDFQSPLDYLLEYQPPSSLTTSCHDYRSPPPFLSHCRTAPPSLLYHRLRGPNLNMERARPFAADFRPPSYHFSDPRTAPTCAMYHRPISSNATEYRPAPFQPLGFQPAPLSVTHCWIPKPCERELQQSGSSYHALPRSSMHSLPSSNHLITRSQIVSAPVVTSQPVPQFAIDSLQPPLLHSIDSVLACPPLVGSQSLPVFHSGAELVPNSSMAFQGNFPSSMIPFCQGNLPQQLNNESQPPSTSKTLSSLIANQPECTNWIVLPAHENSTTGATVGGKLDTSKSENIDDSLKLIRLVVDTAFEPDEAHGHDQRVVARDEPQTHRNCIVTQAVSGNTNQTIMKDRQVGDEDNYSNLNSGVGPRGATVGGELDTLKSENLDDLLQVNRLVIDTAFEPDETNGHDQGVVARDEPKIHCNCNVKQAVSGSSDQIVLKDRQVGDEDSRSNSKSGIGWFNPLARMRGPNRIATPQEDSMEFDLEKNTGMMEVTVRKGESPSSSSDITMQTWDPAPEK